MTRYKQTVLLPELIDETESLKPVNVSSIPQLSPFRYPGGKTWFVPTFRKWISHLSPSPELLIEPFAGGGIITLTALFENLVEKTIMVELDDEIAAVWQSVVNGDANWLADRIIGFNLTKENAIEELRKTPSTTKEKAFQTILKNRTFHGGILAEGSGFLKYGENGKGILSRWYPNTLAKRLINLNFIASRIEFFCADGMNVIKEHINNSAAIFFIDPPYTAGGKKAGKRLYKYYELDHEELFKLCESLNGQFIMTYDNADEVKILARRHGFQMRSIPMTNTHHAKMEELVIGRDLSFLDILPIVREGKPKYGNRKKLQRKGL